MQQLLDTVEEKGNKKGLELNSKKTTVMVISQITECPQINIFINGSKFKQKDQFKYLGILISCDGGNNTEIALRIKSFQKMKSILTNNHISFHTKRTLECFVQPILDVRPGQLQNRCKETGGNRNVVPLENVTNLMVWKSKEIQRNRVTRNKHKKITDNRILKQPLLAM